MNQLPLRKKKKKRFQTLFQALKLWLGNTHAPPVGGAVLHLQESLSVPDEGEHYFIQCTVKTYIDC